MQIMTSLTTAAGTDTSFVIFSEINFTRHRGLLGVFRTYMLGLLRYKNVNSKTVAEYFQIEINTPPKALRWDDLFMHKCRYFTKCLVIGSEAFVREKLTKFS